MKPLGTVITPAILLLLGACTTTPFQSSYEMGKAQLIHNEPHLALQSFRTAAGEEGRTIRVLNALGASYDAMGRPDMAEIYYREALGQSPRDVQTLNNLGWSLMLRDRVEEAAAMLRLASDSAPDDPVVARNLDMAEAKLADIEPAKAPAQTTPQPAAPREFTPGPPMRLGPWVERTARGVQTLRTDMVAFQQAVASDAAPALAVPAVAVSTPACSIEIANGNGRNGAAAHMRQALAPSGMQVVRLINAASFTIERTKIQYPAHCADQARHLAALLPLHAELAPHTGSRIRLVLGRDLPHSATRTTEV